MICTYLRSSLITTFQLCQNRAFIEYSIGKKQPPNRAALIGTACHGVMECLGNEKLAEQLAPPLGKYHGNYDVIYHLKNVYPELDKENPGVFNGESYIECLKILCQMEDYNDGLFNPKNSNMLACELPVDISIQKEWGKYKFETPTQTLEGYVALKGTIDAIVSHDEDTIEIVDYKTGRSKIDWASGQQKTEEKLFSDIQIRLYHYAVCQLFPNIKNILFTIYFLRLDEAITVAIDRSHLKETENILQRWYKKIVETEKFHLNISFRCRFCPWDTNIEKDGKSTCISYRDKIATQGYEITMKNDADFYNLTRYQDGGGKKDRD